MIPEPLFAVTCQLLDVLLNKYRCDHIFNVLDSHNFILLLRPNKKHSVLDYVCDRCQFRLSDVIHNSHTVFTCDEWMIKKIL